jgi:hypothetical protein
VGTGQQFSVVAVAQNSAQSGVWGASVYAVKMSVDGVQVVGCV